jgi:type VI secretion system secreted protein VgrG
MTGGPSTTRPTPRSSAKFKKAGTSSTSPVEFKQRKEVKVDQPICWLADHEKEINVSSVPKYNNTYDPSGQARDYFDTVKYKIYVPTKSNTDVVVELRVRVTYVKDPVTDLADKQDLTGALTKKREVERALAIKNAKDLGAKSLETYWNKKFKIAITDPKCGTRTLPITYKVVWVDSGEHYLMNLHKVYPREGVTGTVIDVSETTDEWTYAHEFAHCYGIPDEYSYVPGNGETVRYRKPDGTEDAPIAVPYNGGHASDPTATVMSAQQCSTVLPRHAWQIAIEVQELLTKKIGRKIKCDIL